MKIELKKTMRWFDIGEFKDLYGAECSIQKSSLATEDAIWLGQNEAGGEPARMHLDQERAAELILLLQKFVETGELS